MQRAVAASREGPSFLFLVLWFLLASDACIANQSQVFLPWFCSMYWLRFMYSLRGERWLGPYLLPILSAVRDTVAFFFVTMGCIAAATHAYVILGPRGEDTFPLYSAFTHTVRLAMFGDFDLFEYLGQDTVFEQNQTNPKLWEPVDPEPISEDLETKTYLYLQGLFFCTGIGVQVLLMNLLIGILSQNYEMQQGRAQVLFVQSRARMLLEQQRRPWAQLKELRKLFHKLSSRWSKGSNGQRAEPAARHGPDEDQQTRDEFDRLHPIYRQCASWGIGALVPLRYVLAPPRRGPLSSAVAPDPEYIFQRFCARMVYKPIVHHPCLSLLFPLMSIVLLALSLVSLLVFVVVALVLRLLGIQVRSAKSE